MKYLTLLFVFVVACGPTEKDKIKTLKDEVISLHDEVMSKMRELGRVRKNLLHKSDSLMENDPNLATRLTIASNDIVDAEERMRNWMLDFKPEYEGAAEEVKQYFEDQKKSIQRVKDDMLTSLAKGQEMLED